MDDFARMIGNRLREVRKEKGLKQEDMERFGLSYKYYQRIENGKVNITIKTIEKIAAAFDMLPSELFTFSPHLSEDINKLSANVQRIIKKGDSASARKVNLFISEFL